MEKYVSCKWIADNLGVSSLTIVYYLFHLRLNRIAKDDGFYVNLETAKELIIFTCSKFGLDTNKYIKELVEHYQKIDDDNDVN